MGREVVWAVAAAVAIVAFLHLQGVVAKTTHVVGDSLGWIVPPGGAAFYSSWAANQSFTVGDVLLFNFTTGAHSVVQVKKKGYDSCDESNGNTIGSIESTGPKSITLSSTGMNCFMCTVGNHCELGQLVAVNVTAASSTPASPPHKAAVPPVTMAAPPLSATPDISPVVPPVLAPTSKSPQTNIVAASSPSPSPSTVSSAPSFTRDGVTTFALALSTVTILAFFL